ncbi:MAG: hypothetical protein K2N88_00580 [Muribaculaceae bacterium]|nr:hypothetical protein [Muribaculaceae bacterium]
MADTLTEALGRLKVRISSLTAENASLREANRKLSEENAQLRELATEAGTARRRAELDAEFLAVSHKLADDPDTLIATRRHIAQLIRNIDRCLEMLKE